MHVCHRAVLCESMCIFSFCPSSSPSNSFPMLLIHSAFLLYFIGDYILVQNCFVSLASGCRYVFFTISLYLVVEFFSFFWNVMFYLDCFTLSRYLFNLPSFTSTFWIISSSYIQTNFASALISLFNSVKFFVEICVKDSFIFLISVLIVLQLWFLGDGISLLPLPPLLMLLLIC